MDSWGARQFAMEGSHFLAEEKTALERHVQKLVREGKLPASAADGILEASAADGAASTSVPTVRRGRPASEFVYQHVKGVIPGNNLPTMKEWGLGTSVGFGGSRWTVNDVSVFDIEEGKRMAKTPRKEPTVFEMKRAAAIQKAAAESPTVNGYRLYPNMTPGRAFMWGTIVAVTGMAIGTKAAMVALEIKELDDVSVRMRQVLRPYVEYIASAMRPWRGLIVAAGEQTDVQNSAVADVARRMKAFLEER
ncbi:unnamed protein product [Ostreobium quekettii]|uniref:Uncharacterized protein n=1 Tax=Ostreobium quekettii TaxID=121088 RepID=A0A8S1IX76_9CHLO|nr:unnamed protein product [Ostreobium quekettii]|eukprot:evm.model.scf_732EXC.2 EVM.evm.TU.scf_732EXC.2   scf_732EXC:8268-11115(+)